MTATDRQGGTARKITTGLYVIVNVAAFLIYMRGVHGPYILDDYPNLVFNQALHLKHVNPRSLERAARSSSSGPLGRPLSMLSFAANYYLSGNTSPYSIKLTNIILHLLVGAGVFVLCLLVLPCLLPTGPDPPWIRDLVALAAASLWLLHPLFVSTVLYSVQRMTILSALVVIYTCIGYLQLRRRSVEDNRGYLAMLAAASAGTVAAALCKENGALLPVFLLILEGFCFRFRLHDAAPGWVRMLFKPLLFAPLVVILGYLAAQLRFAAHGSPQFHFTLYQRLITEPRVLWNYVGWLAFLNPAPLGLVHANFHKSVSLLSPPSTLFSIIGWIGVAGTCVFAAAKPALRVYAFGITWFLGGQLLESTTIPLALMFEHRNYLPGLGLVLCLAAAARYFVSGTGKQRVLGLAMAAYVFLLLPSWLLYQRVGQWRNEKTLTMSLLRVDPHSAWTWIQLAQLYTHEDRYTQALEALHRAQKIQPREQSHLFNEAALRCHYESRFQLPGALSRKLKMTDYDHPSSRAALWGFRLFARTCARPGANRFFTLGILKRAAHSKDRHLAVLARNALVEFYPAQDAQIRQTNQ